MFPISRQYHSICRSKIKIFQKQHRSSTRHPTYTQPTPRLPFRSRFLLSLSTSRPYQYLEIPTYPRVFNNCAPPHRLCRENFIEKTAHGEPAALWTSRNTIDERERASNTTSNRGGKSEPSSSSKRLAKHTEIILKSTNRYWWLVDRWSSKGGSSLSKYCSNEREREGEKEREESFRFPVEKERQVSLGGGGGGESGGIHEGVDEEAEVGETFISPLFLPR